MSLHLYTVTYRRTNRGRIERDTRYAFVARIDDAKRAHPRSNDPIWEFDQAEAVKGSGVFNRGACLVGWAPPESRGEQN